MDQYFTVTELEKKPRLPEAKPGKGLSGADRGNLVHAVLKEIDRLSEMPLTKLIGLQAFNLGLILSKAEREEAARMIERAPKPEEGFHELPFRLKLKNGVISGVIDYAFPSKEGWILLDFKTDSSFDKERYRLQMDTYALALSKAKSEGVIETRLIFLRLGRTHTEACTKERLEKTEKDLEKRMA